jgi:hypothetical protein
MQDIHPRRIYARLNRETLGVLTDGQVPRTPAKNGEKQSLVKTV